ncbi:hypothetical protein D9M70_645540 [compost metagenome]
MLGHVDLLEMPEAQHPRTVEQQAQVAVVAAAEIRQGSFDRSQVGHVQRPLPDAAQVRRQGGQGLGVAVEQPHLPAPCMEQPRRGGADAGSGAGDQDIVHVRPVPPHACR